MIKDIKGDTKMKSIMLILALVACMWEPAEAADNCVMIADGFLEAADAGRRGVPVSQLTERLRQIAGDRKDLSDYTIAQVRLEFLEAYQRGANGEPMGDIWAHYFAVCKHDEAKKPEHEL